MDLSYSRKEKIVGLFFIAIGLLLLSTVIILGRGKNWFADHNIYYTTFDESYNLKVGADVKLFKTNIGKVKAISVEEKVRIKLAILQKYESRIREDTVVTVESPTFVGSEYVSIIPGSADTPLMPQEGELPSKAKKSIDDILAEFEVEKTAKKLVQAIQNIGDLTQMLKDPQGPLFASLENINQASQYINQASQHINQATRDIADITAGMETGEGTIGNLLTSTQVLDVILKRLEKVGEILADISQATAKTPETMDLVQSRLTDFQAVSSGLVESVAVLKNIFVELEKNLPTIAAILNNAEKGSRDVPEITTSVTRTIQETREGIENVDKVIQSLQNNFLIKPNLPPEPVGENTDAGLRR